MQPVKITFNFKYAEEINICVYVWDLIALNYPNYPLITSYLPHTHYQGNVCISVL